MKKKNLFSLVALATLTLGSCTNDEVVNDYSQDNAIQFGTYMGRDAQARASIFDDTDLKGDEIGFGVYAYYTAQATWENYAKKNEGPNFMNNTHVTYNSTSAAWEYTPLKYWPNTKGDKVSFFAYAPWSAGGEDALIKTENGVITFKVDNDVQKQIDLTAVEAAQLDLTNDTRYLNEKVEFKFKHILSKIEFTLQAAANQVEAGGTINEGTTITLNKIVIGDEKNGSFYVTGDYSILANNWDNETGSQSFTLEIGDFIDDSNVLTNEDNSKKTLIDADGDDYIMIIPQTLTKLPITVTYTVETVSDDNKDNSKVENVVTKEIESITFEKGKGYVLNLVLGMNTVDLTASVEPWDDETSSTQVDLPLNVETLPTTPEEGGQTNTGGVVNP